MDYSTKNLKPDGSYSPSGTGSYNDYQDYSIELEQQQPWNRRIVSSFRRDPNAHATPKGAVGGEGRVFDVENAAQATATSPLQRTLKGRHLQMWVHFGARLALCPR